MDTVIKPILCFTFANDRLRYLNALSNEAGDIIGLFRDKQHLCDTALVPNLRAKDLHDIISKQGKQIHVFHYGGHADGYQTALNDDYNQRQLFDGKAFVKLLTGLPHLKLVFLNGCKTRQMVNELFDAGVPVVIGTNTSIGDEIATELSYAFYKGIADQNTIAQAWKMAVAFMEGKYSRHNSFRELYWEGNEEEKMIDNDTIPNELDISELACGAWFIRIQKDAGDWKLIEIIDTPPPTVHNNTTTIIGDKNIHITNNNNSDINIHINSSSTDKKNDGFPAYYNISPTSLTHKVIGREDDLEAVHKMLVEKKQCIVVNGIGGIGKTTLARYYVQKYHAEYQHIIWLEERESVADMFLGNIEFLELLGISTQITEANKTGNLKTAYTILMQRLNALAKPCLLIADNVKKLTELQTAITVLDTTHFHLLVSSREETADFYVHKLDELSPEAAEDLFCLYYFGKTPPNSQKEATLRANPALNKLLERVAYHTLTIELFAKMLQRNPLLTLESLLTRLDEQVITPSLKQKIHTTYTQKEATLYETIIAAFDISNLSQNPNALTLLAQFSVLPSSHIPQDILMTILGVTDNNADDISLALTYLIDNAWLQIDKTTDNTYYCHTLIQEAVRIQYPLPDDIYDEMVENINNNIYNIVINNPIQATYLLPYAETLLRHYARETALISNLYNNTASVYNSLGQYNKALAYHLKVLDIREKVSPNDHPNLANSYNNLANTYYRFGKYDKALTYHLKALAILEKVLPNNHPDLALSYNNLAETYRSLGEYDKALTYHLKALDILDKVLPNDHPNLATSYNNLALTYSNLGENDKALTYHLKALDIREKILPNDHPDLAQSYNNLAETYRSLGEYDKALVHHLKALDIREKVLPNDHPNLATSYNNLALTYSNLGENDKALTYHLKDLVILEKILSNDHPDLATSYNNLASTYSYLGQFNKALTYYLKALDILEKVLPNDHPHLAQSYNNLALTYYYLEEKLQSLAYFQKAIEKWKRYLPVEHPYTKSAVNNMKDVLIEYIVAGKGEDVAEYIQWYVQECEGYA